MRRGTPVTTENDAAVLAASTETVTPTDAQVEAETAVEAELDNAESSEPQEGESQDEGEDKVQAEIDRATRKARRRIEKLVADRAALATEKNRLEAELAQAKAAKEDGKKPEEDPREIARQIRAVEKTSEAIAKVMAEGKKLPDFETAVSELVEELGPQIDPQGRPTALLEAVLDSDRAAEVLHYLGREPEVAASISGLTPAQIGRRIARIEAELDAKAKPKTSAAPKPLSPVKPAPAPAVDETKLTDAQWAALHKKAKQAA
jgi:chromosome segregation ATPase